MDLQRRLGTTWRELRRVIIAGIVVGCLGIAMTFGNTAMNTVESRTSDNIVLVYSSDGLADTQLEEFERTFRQNNKGLTLEFKVRAQHSAVYRIVKF